VIARVLAVGLLAVAVGGCRDTVAGEEIEFLLPEVAGTWTGGFVGDLGVPGSDVVLRDTFGLTFAVVQDSTEFGYSGTVRRGPDQRPLFDCAPRLLDTSGDDRQLAFDCVQATQLGETLVLRVVGSADAEHEALTGVVRDRYGVDGTVAITLTRDPS